MLQTTIILDGKSIGHIEQIASIDEDTGVLETMLHGVVYDGNRPYTIDGYSLSEQDELNTAIINLYNERIL